MLTEWALLGQGIALKPFWEVADHLREGRLEPVLPDFPPEPAVLAVLYPHRRLLPAKVKAFADFMVEHGPRALADLDRPASQTRHSQGPDRRCASAHAAGRAMRQAWTPSTYQSIFCSSSSEACSPSAITTSPAWLVTGPANGCSVPAMMPSLTASAACAASSVTAWP